MAASFNLARMAAIFSAIDIPVLLSSIMEKQRRRRDSVAFAGLCDLSGGLQRLDGGQGRDGVLVNHLLSAIRYQYHHEAVKSGDNTTELEAVHQEEGDGYLVPADFLQNGVLLIDRF